LANQFATDQRDGRSRKFSVISKKALKENSQSLLFKCGGNGITKSLLKDHVTITGGGEKIKGILNLEDIIEYILKSSRPTGSL